jgi:cytochrome d ubiquinol oxidase subunit I
MDAVMLARIQFSLAAGFHYIFPPLTLGLTLIILILETKYLRSDDALYKKISTFMIKILALVFALGVASGIVLEFSFGTNWASYARMVGDIFGAPLAAEGIFAFFMESVFLGVLVFGRNTVTKRVYWLSAFLVFFASHLSGLWIIIANSWMQTPAGFKIEEGRAILTNFFAAMFNDSTLIRFLHTIIGGWITGSLFSAGIASWFILKKRDLATAKPLLSTALWIFISASLVQLATGHIHSEQVAKTQPEKMASFEALWETRRGAPMSIIGIPDPALKKTHFEISIPKLLSLGIHLDPDARIQGLNEFREDELPPVVTSYLTYHVMILFGLLFILMAFIALFLKFRKKLFESHRFMALLIFTVPLPFIANILGWMSAEIGRQPWAVYRVLRTVDAASVVVPAGHILFSIIMFSAIYLLIFAVFIKLLVKIVQKGPEQVVVGYSEE